MIRRFPLLAAMTMSLLAGCAAVPKDQPRIAPLAAATTGLTATDIAPIPADWWTALGDAQLDRIMADAMAGSPTLAAALARVRAAEAGIAANRAGLLPHLGVDVDEERQRLSEKYIIPPPYGGSTQWVGTAQANLSWTLDFAGKQKALVDQARAGARAAALDAAAAKIALSGAVAQTYLNLARADAQAKIAAAFVASREQSLSLARSRIRNQLASNFDARAAETLVAEAKQAQVRAEGDRQLMIHALAALAGKGADYYATVTPPSLALDRTLPLPGALPADLLGRRADIQAAQARIDAASAGRRAARADFFPNVDLKAFIGAQALGLGALFTSGAIAYGGGPAIHLPIFEGGRLSANYRGATAQIDVAIADYNDLVVQAVKQAADALSSVQTSAAEAEQQARTLAALQDTVRLDTIRLRTGLGSRLDILASDDRLLQARQAQVNIAADGAVRRVQLLVALGGGFENSPAVADAAAGASMRARP
ncbi:efflux transporter outer membrane subunit [Flavisphingomonas formosensis]|uniref:efflux transporter outer membrane subunit n=1 Tax=Flavisphingomonas formosensis TaxID=861534 RepID=UPI0012FCA2C7|nr:efflux transporter outer membrane subunit [Sphingomonas formosensis]